MIYGILFYQAEKQIKHHILTINWILILKISTHLYFIASSSNCYINYIEPLWNINVLVDHQFNWYIINIFIVYLSYIIYKHFLYYVVNVYIDLCLYSRAYTIDMYSQRIICPNAACLITFIHIILNYLKKYNIRWNTYTVVERVSREKRQCHCYFVCLYPVVHYHLNIDWNQHSERLRGYQGTRPSNALPQK